MIQIGSTKIFIELLPSQFNNFPTPLEKVTHLFEDIEKTLNGLIAVLTLAEEQTWTPSCAQELKLILILFSDMISFGEILFDKESIKEKLRGDSKLNEKERRLVHRFRDVLQKCFSFIDHNIQVNHVSTSSSSRRADIRGEFNLK